jgi:hypothetical protein
MPVFRPRNRLVNFRLSEDEFDRLRASCALQGARSLSDFARAAVLRAVAGTGHNDATEPPANPADPRLAALDRKVNDLEARVGELLDLLHGLEREQSRAVEVG